MRTNIIIVVFAILALASCKKAGIQPGAVREDRAAKRMLQGVWVNDDEESVAFMAKGDTIFYPDSTSQPVYFQIVHDTLVLHGANVTKYPILKLAPHLFEFRNQAGDVVKLEKSSDRNDLLLFRHKRPVALNQNTLIKRDSVVNNANEAFHCYVQVNPTTFKVIKATYNDDGVEVDNVYHDNIVNVNVYKGAQRIFSRDFHKQDFRRYVPADFLESSVLSDIILEHAASDGIHFYAVLAMPDSQMSYNVNIVIAYDGRLSMSVKNS